VLCAISIPTMSATALVSLQNGNGERNTAHRINKSKPKRYYVKEKAKNLLIDKDKHPHPPARRLSVILVIVKSMNGLV
jgi:hypothetical protein